MAKKRYVKKEPFNEVLVRDFLQGCLENEIMWLRHGLKEMKGYTELLHPGDEQHLRDLMSQFATETQTNLSSLSNASINKLLSIIEDYS